MSRFAAGLCLCLTILCVSPVFAVSDPFALYLAQKSLGALISSGSPALNDVTLNGNAILILGSDYETGTATFRAKGTTESRLDLNLTNWTRADVRNALSGLPAGAWETNGNPSTAYAQQNCWTDAVWFLPELSSLTQTGNQNYIFLYMGLQQYGGVTAQHIQVYQLSVPGLSVVDFYLDPVSYWPLGIAFNAYADVDMNANIPMEIRFANYQSVSGIQVPFHVQQISNGSVALDVTVTSAAFNTGLPDSLFTLP